ncbi:RNase adapter RapZ [Candidatus Babeliales bacterium]|nr:RNase adapter RapZ [Candidatus Babeliales bacterium]
MFTSNINLKEKERTTTQIKEVLIVTGLSGAGKTSLMSALGDFGFYCVDNLPLPLLSDFLNLAFQSQTKLFKVALGIDSRCQNFLTDFIWQMDKIKTSQLPDVKVRIIFLGASKNILLRRFQETRRNHPLLANKIDLVEAIEKEIELLEPVKRMSDIILDTDVFNVHDLRRWVGNFFVKKSGREMLVSLISFGFKFGIPQESNLVYDLRFLPNPHFEPDLKMLDGRHDFIKRFLFKKEVVSSYWLRLKDFLKYSIENFYKEGRFFVNVAIGCTGGKHRSVAFVEKLGQEKWLSVKFLIRHRDLGKE